LANGDISAIRIASAAAHNGWVAEIDISGLSPGGTYALGLGTNNDPSTAKIVFTVTSSGYDATGVLGTIQRTVYGTHQVRKPSPNQATNDESGTVTVRVSLSDFVFTGDTLTATIASGFYTQGGTPTNSVSSFAVTNNSTLAHPKVIANWSWPGWQKVSGPSFDVRCVAFHRSAINGKPVACVIFTATDQHSHSVSVTVAAATIDPLMGDYGEVSEYIATISTSTFTAGDQITVNFKAYPWVGNSGATLDTSDGVNSQPTPKYAPQFYVYDGGTYGTSAAVVDSTFGSDTTGVAVDEKTFDSLSPPPAFRTINKAVAAVNSRNNTVYGRNDAAGSVHLKAGNHTWTGASNSISATVGKVWCTVQPLGSTPRASVIINAVSGTQGFAGTPVKVWNCSINVATGPVSLFTDITYMWMDQCTFVCNGTTAIYQTVLYYMTRNSIGAIAHDLTPFGGEVSNAALIRGNDLYGCGGTPVWTTLGNTNSVIHQNIFSNEPVGGPTANTMPILAFNTMYRQDVSVEMACQIHNATAGIIGAAIVQNIFENNSSGELELFITADASTSNPANNVLMWHNTLVGGRINRGYNDTGSSSLLRTLWSEVGNMTEKEAIKSDTFPTADAARTGNWPVLYGVGRRGCLNVEATPLAASGQFQLEFDGISSYAPAKNGGSNPITSATNPIAFSGLLGRLAWNGGTANVGGGDYRIQPHSLLRNLIPSGGAVLPYDIFGVPRKNDGTGAAGAYEFATAGASVAEFDEDLELTAWFESELVTAAIRWFDDDLQQGVAAPTAGNASLSEFDDDLENLAWFEPELVAAALRWFDDDIKESVAQHYTLSMGQGSYTLTGQAVAVTAQRKLVIAQGSYTYTGQGVLLVAARKLILAQGSYALTGQSVTLTASRKLLLAQGSYTLTGQVVSLIHGFTCTMSQGSYALTGQAVTMVHGYTLTVSQGTYTLSGQPVALKASRKLVLAQGSCSLSGQLVALTYSGAPANTYTLTIGQGTFALSGQSIALAASRKLALAQGSNTMTGQSLTLQAARKLTFVQGSFTLNGQTLSLRASRSLVMTKADYTLTGQACALKSSRALVLFPGSFVLTGQTLTMQFSGAGGLESFTESSTEAIGLPYTTERIGLPYSTEAVALPFTTRRT